MAVKITTLKDGSGTAIYPRVSAHHIYKKDGSKLELLNQNETAISFPVLNYLNNEGSTSNIENALDGKQAKITTNGVLQGNGSGAISAKAVDTTPTASSSNLITSGAVKNALDGKQAKIIANGVLQGNGSGTITAKSVDTTPTANSSNLITSGAVKTAINNIDSQFSWQGTNGNAGNGSIVHKNCGTVSFKIGDIVVMTGQYTVSTTANQPYIETVNLDGGYGFAVPPVVICSQLYDTQNVIIRADEITASSFKIRIPSFSSSVIRSFSWIAIGRWSI